MINGSPKTGKNNSQYFINELEKMLQDSRDLSSPEIINIRIKRPNIDDASVEQILTSDILILCFPLYVDAIPSHLLGILQDLEGCFRNQTKKPLVYTMVHCGFYEAVQNHLALEMIRHWCSRSGLIWEQGLGIGGSEMQGNLDSVPCGHGPKKNLGRMMGSLADSIVHQSSGPDLFANPNFPKLGFVFMGSIGWCQMAKKNGVRKKELYAQP